MAVSDDLRTLIRKVNASKPFRGDDSSPCTIRDMDKLIDNLVNVLTAIADELER